MVKFWALGAQWLRRGQLSSRGRGRQARLFVLILCVPHSRKGRRKQYGAHRWLLFALIALGTLAQTQVCPFLAQLTPIAPNTRQQRLQRHPFPEQTLFPTPLRLIVEWVRLPVVVVGEAFRYRLRCTLGVFWGAGAQNGWYLLTDLRPGAAIGAMPTAQHQPAI